MAVIARRALLAGSGVAAGAAVSLAAALLLRKPPAPQVPVLRPDAVQLRPLSALQPIAPPRALPAISYQDAEGATHGLAELRGKGVVLNLWATWCPPCVAEMPALAALQRAAGPDIVVLPLSSDRGGAATVARFYREHGITGLPVALDPNAAAVEALGARGLPTTFILDRAGSARAQLEGAPDWGSAAALARVRALAL